MPQKTDNDLLCDATDIEERYTAKLLKEILFNYNVDWVDAPMVNVFLTEIHARIISTQQDLELKSSKITIEIMRQEIENLKMFEQDIYDMYPEYFL